MPRSKNTVVGNEHDRKYKFHLTVYQPIFLPNETKTGAYSNYLILVL